MDASSPLLDAAVNLAHYHREQERFYSSAALEVIARAADLCGESARLVHDNDRPWRVFRDRVAAVRAGAGLDRAVAARRQP